MRRRPISCLAMFIFAVIVGAGIFAAVVYLVLHKRFP